MNQLKFEIDALKNSKSEEDRKKCIPLLSEFLKQNPSDAEAWYDLACCYDFLGYEKDAEPCYLRAYEFGWKKIPPDEQRNFFVGYGSTLRNNKKLEQSEKILREGIENFPNDPTLLVFLALTQYSRNQFQDCARSLFTCLGKLPQDNFDGYERAIEWYTIHLDPASNNKTKK